VHTTLHPRRGPHRPATSTPPRRPGSVRRTTSHDSVRPDGLTERLVLTASGRDLRTDAESQPTELGTARVDLDIAFLNQRTITSVTIDPPAAGIGRLVGASAASGFRALVDDVLPGERGAGTLRYQLLDDLPTAVLVSGNALHAVLDMPRDPERMLTGADQCAGWATGASIMDGWAGAGATPRVTGPLAPPLVGSDDPLAWHPLAAQGPNDMRRVRRVDVWLEDDGAHVDAFFRDTHVLPDGDDTVLHEYGVRAVVDLTSRTFTACEASVGVLPWQECPGALASAGRLVGAPVDDLRARVRRTFTGTSTCTHLNDTLRALQDVPTLLDAL
jgi:hypothetical protein